MELKAGSQDIIEKHLQDFLKRHKKEVKKLKGIVEFFMGEIKRAHPEIRGDKLKELLLKRLNK